ncbi:MAG: choline dehydrogenase-like flavoprotein [Bradymonadia bacterium]|jgi:choline dehydrogenase-like flavoprotein
MADTGGEFIDGRSADAPSELRADVVIVGSGAGGCVAAAVLAEAGLSVVVLEEGPHVKPEQYAGFRPSESLRKIWRDGALTAALGVGKSPLINVTMGRCVGGSSVLTGGVCFRTPEHVLHEWQHSRGLSELGPEEMEPFFDQVEKDVHVETVPADMRSRSTTLWGEGARKAFGIELESTRRNTKDCVGHGRCNFGCPKGAKLSVDVSYLPRAMRKGALVVSSAKVRRLTMKGAKATSVTARLESGGTLTVIADRVIVAASAVYTPGILKRSGLGNRKHLGRHMTLHPGFRMMARFDEPVIGWKGAMQSAYTDAFLESEGITLISLFVPPSTVAAGIPGFGTPFMERANGLGNIAMFGGMIHDEGGGRVYSPPIGDPVMTYRMSNGDRVALSKLVRRLGQAYLEAGARELYLPVLGHEPVGPDEFQRVEFDSIAASRFECSSQHPLGTCRMGPESSVSVVDARGKVWGTENVYVLDGSVVPTSLGVNPQETIMAMALRIASRMVG